MHYNIGKVNQDKGNIDTAIENYLEAIRQVHITLMVVCLHFPLARRTIGNTHPFEELSFSILDYRVFNHEIDLDYRGFNSVLRRLFLSNKLLR